MNSTLRSLNAEPDSTRKQSPAMQPIPHLNPNSPYFSHPHKPSSEGKVSLENGMEYYVSVIGAEWIEREDRVPV